MEDFKIFKIFVWIAFIAILIGFLILIEKTFSVIEAKDIIFALNYALALSIAVIFVAISMDWYKLSKLVLPPIPLSIFVGGLFFLTLTAILLVKTDATEKSHAGSLVLSWVGLISLIVGSVMISFNALRIKNSIQLVILMEFAELPLSSPLILIGQSVLPILSPLTLVLLVGGIILLFITTILMSVWVKRGYLL